MAQVLWRDAEGKEGSIQLSTDTPAQIGRAKDCGIRTDDGMVSRYHARISAQAGAYVIEDLDSANGIYVDEKRLKRHTLSHGDAVRCGSLWLRFVDPKAKKKENAAPTPAVQPKPSSNSDETKRFQRRIDQLQAELRLYRGGGAKAIRIEELEQDHQATCLERDALKKQVKQLEQQILEEGAAAKVQRADQIRETAADLVAQLNDLLSDLRINVTAAEGEFELFAEAIPRASFELIREALRTAATDLDKTRDLLRELRAISS